MSRQPLALYRHALRELRLNDSLHKFRDHRSNSDVLQALRKTFESSQSGQAASSIREMTELAAFMKANRLHQGLLERYNGGLDMTQEERSRLSARRVGLNMPKEYSEDENK